MSILQSSITKVEDGSIVTPKGFKAIGSHAGIKQNQQLDLGLIYCEVPAHAAAVFTLNKVQAAPILVSKDSLAKDGKLQAVIVNSGNANACTGEQGLQAAYRMRDTVADHFNLKKHHVAVASTGVIGERLPIELIETAIPKLKPTADEEHAKTFSQSILTTDTVTKTTCYQAEIDGQIVTVAGSAKGSGMIQPNMATMLGFITTDAHVDSKSLQLALSEVTQKTFNCITVDGDTSTNDTVFVMASGLSKTENLTPAHEQWDVFIKMLQQVCEDLAKMIARDGEGATKLIQVDVTGAVNDEQAIQVGKSIVGSSLVKTAIFGRDMNWGRIIAAAGYSGADINPNTIDLAVGPIQLLENSQPLAYEEKEALAYLDQEEIIIKVDLKQGTGQGTCWGCDLTYEYININASYRT